MAALCDEKGQQAVAGKSVGYWLNDTDFVSTEELPAKDLGNIGFPRDWPNVYTKSKPLKSLIGKKGKCAGKKVGVVGAPLPEEVDSIKGITLYHLQSFSNAERVEKAAGMPVVQGWAVFEHLDQDVSAAFVAERYWWNSLPDGQWVDFTPRPKDWPELLLAEAANDASKSKDKLAAAEVDLATHLLQKRFKVKPAAAAAAAKPSAEPKAAKAEPKAEKTATKASGSVKDLIKRIGADDAEAIQELQEKAKGNEALCIQAVSSGVVPPLAKMLDQANAKCTESLKLLLLLSDAGVGQKDGEVQTAFFDSKMVPALVKLLKEGDSKIKEHCAAILGNLCHESPANQDLLVKSGAIQPLSNLLSEEVGPAQEAAYALWNLMVGHEANSIKVVESGAVPKLAELLKSTSEIAQENAAGALMHVSMSKDARKAIGDANAIARLCELLSSSFEPEVSCQAAGALLNLSSECPEYTKAILKHGAITSLIKLAESGADLAQEYAAGALMNLIRGDLDVAEKAMKEGVVRVLASLLSKQTGHSEALGALANLASGSPERQIQIYKAQVTRKSVALLTATDVEVRRNAAALIMNLAPHGKIKERIVEAGAMKNLAGVLKDSDGAVKERAAGALANLFNDHSGNVHAGFEQAPDMIPSLVEILKVPDLTVDAKRQAAHALAMFAGEDGPCDAVWKAGAGKPLLKLLQEGVAEAALGIMNLSWRWAEVKQELAQGKALDALMKMVGSGEDMAKEYAAGALMNMTAGSQDNAKAVVKVVPELTEMLKGKSVQGCEWAAGALANIIRVDAEAQKAAVAGGAAASLVSLLTKARADGRTLIVLSLTALCENNGGSTVQKALSSGGGKEKLVEFRDSGNDDLADYVNALVKQIGNGFSL